MHLTDMGITLIDVDRRGTWCPRVCSLPYAAPHLVRSSLRSLNQSFSLTIDHHRIPMRRESFCESGVIICSRRFAIVVGVRDK